MQCGNKVQRIIRSWNAKKQWNDRKLLTTPKQEGHIQNSVLWKLSWKIDCNNVKCNESWNITQRKGCKQGHKIGNYNWNKVLKNSWMKGQMGETLKSQTWFETK